MPGAEDKLKLELRTITIYRFRSTGGFSFGVPPELKYQSERLPTTAITRIIDTTIILNAIFAVFFSALYTTNATARNTRKNDRATINPTVETLGAA